MQDDDGALFRVQAPERQVEEFAVGHDRCDVGHRRSIDRQKLHLDRPSPPTSQDVDARTDDETSEPALEAIRIAERGQVPPGAKEAFLDRVSRELVVPKDQSGSRIQPRDERAGKHREGLMIASLRSNDELSLVHGHPVHCGAAIKSRSECKSPWSAKGFPRGVSAQR